MAEPMHVLNTIHKKNSVNISLMEIRSLQNITLEFSV